MHVVCKTCGYKIPTTGRPKGSVSLSRVRADGNVGIGDGAITFGPGGGSISFGKGGRVGFGAAQPSNFACPECKSSSDYEAAEIKDD